MIILGAWGNQGEFAAVIAELERQLHPHVVYARHTFGDDSNGEPAVFFKILLSDAASKRDQLMNVTNQISAAIVQQVEPLEQWGVLPYFNSLSQTEQAILRAEA